MNIIIISGIITEFNPFHNGHKYILEKAKENSDFVVAVMSGNYVQRGEPAIFNKFTRAKAALTCGADIVIELPSPWSCSFAENFAFGAISLLKNFNVNKLYFGAESNDIKKMLQIAKIDTNLKISDDKNKTYAVLRKNAIEKLLGKDTAKILDTPNNNLAIEYIKAANKQKLDLEFIPIERINAPHDSNINENGFASATHIRNLIIDNKPFFELVPPILNDLYVDVLEQGKYLDYNKYSNALISYLRRINDYSCVSDIDTDLENRLKKALLKATNLEELLISVKTKRYTLARIRRIILNAFLINNNNYTLKEVPYINVLGFTKKGEELLKATAKESKLPIIIAMKSNIKLNSKTKKLLEEEVVRNDVYSSLLKIPDECKKDYTNGIIKME